MGGAASHGKRCLKALAICRLEELALEHPEANLRAFDPRLAAAAKALRGDGRWSKALAAGGSDAAALAAPLPAAGAEVQLRRSVKFDLRVSIQLAWDWASASLQDKVLERSA